MMGFSARSGDVCPLDINPIFQRITFDIEDWQRRYHRGRIDAIGWNLIAFDGHCRLFAWDNTQRMLHFVEVHRSDEPGNGESDDGRGPSSAGGILGKVQLLTPAGDEDPFQTVDLPIAVDFTVRQMAINRSGKALALVGDKMIAVLELQHRHSGRASGQSAPIKCSKGMIVGTRLFPGGKDHALRILQLAWHPCSDTHIGVLSSDGVFRLFDLSCDCEQPEQEYYLRPGQRKGGSIVGVKGLINPVAFTFGGDHLWDRFMVLFLFGNGSMYLLCPVVPLGSRIRYSAIEELVNDTRAMSGVAAEAASSWLREVFPGFESATHESPARTTRIGAVVAPTLLKAHPYVSLDASLRLQGPLVTLPEDDSHEFTASSLVYTVVGIDSVITVAGKDGKIRVYGMANEVQPAWDQGRSPHVAMDESRGITSIAMIVEASGGEVGPDPGKHNEGPSGAVKRRGGGGGFRSSAETDRSDVVDNLEVSVEVNVLRSTTNAGLVRFAMLDLALAPNLLSVTPIALVPDPMISQQMYVCHAGGIDAIFLVWLPFSDGLDGLNGRGSFELPSPRLEPLLDTCGTSPEDEVPLPLLGVVSLADALGESWLVAVTAAGEAAVMRMKPHGLAMSTGGPPTALHFAGETSSRASSPPSSDAGLIQTTSRDIILGPKNIPIPKVVSSAKPLTVASTEGKFFLHERCKLLHEKYIEYANRVHFELCAHAARLARTVEDQLATAKNIKEKLEALQDMAAVHKERLESAMQYNEQLEDHIELFSGEQQNMKKPLSTAEKEYMSQLHELQWQELELLKGSAEELHARSQQLLKQANASQESQRGTGNSPNARYGPSLSPVPSSQMRRTKIALENLLGVIADMNKQVQQIEACVAQKERLQD